MKTQNPVADRRLVDAIQASALYKSYQQAFRKATGLPMFLRLVNSDVIPRMSERAEQNPFCEALNGGGHPCEQCMATHAKLKATIRGEACACTGSCFAHMSEAAVPVVSGGHPIAYLWTGQVFASGAKKAGFRSVERVIRESGLAEEEIDHLKRLWNATPEVPPEKCEGVVTLLEAFARQLSDLAGRLVMESQPQEPDNITRTRRYIQENLTERLTLEEVARAAGLSPHHFCKVFRRSTGLNLTEYINRARVEMARQMLLREDARVSEIAFEVGYQSLSQFNRSFRTITGQSPSDFRRRVLKPDARRLA